MSNPKIAELIEPLLRYELQDLSQNDKFKTVYDKKQAALNKATAAITAYIEKEIIDHQSELFFSNEIPRYNSLEEYMEAVVKTRDRLRTEQRQKLKGES